MTALAFLGLGAMGSRMAARLLEAGHDLTVWNRSDGPAADLEAAGAKRAQTPRAAASGAEVVFAMVRDDAASARVWLDEADGALDGLKDGAVGVDCSTLSVPFVHKLSAAFVAQGRPLLDAPVAGSRPQAEAAQLIFLAGGEAAQVEAVRPLLSAMGGAVHHAGAQGAGATVKLMVNAMLGTQLALMGELIGFADKAGIDAKTAIEIVGSIPVCSPAAKLASEAMLKGAFAPAFPIDLVAKDFDLIRETAGAFAADIPLANAAGAVYRHAEDAGYADDNITGVVQLYRGEAS
ncbi:MAG: NAD(P)-dependent oxidoreductase [Pseudomonadota bacterium]